MGFHLAILIAKLNLMAATTHLNLTPFLAILLCPFMLKFLFSLRPLRQLLFHMTYSVRLFFFQITQILNSAPNMESPSILRWDRVVRIIGERLNRRARRLWHQVDIDEEGDLRASILLARTPSLSI